VYRIDSNARVPAWLLVRKSQESYVASNLHQLLRNPVPFPAHLRRLAHVSKIAQHAAIANLRSLARFITLVLHVWTNVFEDALQDVFVQALGKVASSTDRHVRDLAG
jgi:hypothetical protein